MGIARREIWMLHLRSEKGMVENGIVLDGVTYTSFITGLCLQGRVSIAERMLREMSGSGIKPDDATYTMVIDAICKNGDVKMGYTSDLQLQKILTPCPTLPQSVVSGTENCKVLKLTSRFIEDLLDGVKGSCIYIKLLFSVLTSSFEFAS
ncbi:pentatricopeptide repeat-containing protein At5g41170, mitochondrial-like [Ipomoea triloba]|uniref:pentatricopeptide repeat-containing protein At5g41170, mitochondrial-like n=1 Tax=Ipomoea triloba TaxID=35885 RepID=UPI00125D4B67|nr:pentatricopeptide repeat-containing protein At5g41170, mitochondrial-like [Ipomoea triloba]